MSTTEQSREDFQGLAAGESGAAVEDVAESERSDDAGEVGEAVRGEAERARDVDELAAAGPSGAVGEAEGAGDGGGGEDSRGGAAWWSRRRIAAVAVLVAALLLSGGLLYGAEELKDPAASGNHTLTDAAATDQVTGDVSNALSRIFAYTPDDTQSTAQAAHDVLDGAAATQYQALFARIRGQVVAQRLTLTTRVVRAGVVTLTAHRARLLVFLDQTAQRAGGTATSAAAQLSVTAELKGGHWRITELTAR
jgi:Mce-associated membrane protein